jgi:ABC-2 type transport system ATP-binding protein
MEEAERLSDELLIMDHGVVIARGTPTSIIASLGADSLVQFSVAEGPGVALGDEALRGLDGVRTVRREGESVILTVVHTRRVISSLFDLANEHGAELDDLRTHRPTLEDVFVSMTGKRLRDE